MTEIEKKEIAEIMKKHGVLVGFVFGSAVNGSLGPRSDVDTAVLFDEEIVPEKKQFDAKLAMMGEIAKCCGVENADVINLNQVTEPVIRYESVIRGVPVLVKDPSAKASLVRRVLREYEDTKKLRETSYEILRRQAKTGEFGRAPANLKKHVAT